MATTKDLGIVSAYGYAVEKGYTGTEEEFAELMYNVSESAGTSEAWAVGSVGGVPVEEGAEQYENNAKYYAEQAGGDAENAEQSKDSAKASADTSEAWAVGTVGGVPVEEGHTGYNNNAKYHAEQASESADAAANSEAAAKDYSDHIADPVSGIVTGWLAEHVDPDTGYVIDDTLTVQGAAADAKATGDELTNVKSALEADVTALELDTIEYTDLPNTGKVILGTTISDNPYYSISNAIFVKRGMVVSGKTRTDNTSVTIIAECDASGNILERLEIGISAAVKTFSYTIPRDMYIRICLNNHSSYTGWALIAPGYANRIDTKSDTLNNRLNKYIKPLNLIDIAEIYTNVEFVNKNSASITGDIISGSSTIAIVPVVPSETYYITQTSRAFYNIVLYNSSMEFISSLYAYHSDGGWNKEWSVPNNCYYVGIMITSAYLDTAFYGKSSDYTAWQAEKIARLNPDVIVAPNAEYKNHRLIATDDSMSDGDTLSFDTSDIKQNYVFSFTGKLSGAFSSIYMAHGKTGSYSGMFAEIDNTNIKFYRYHSSDILVNTVPHGLTIADFITVSVELLEDETAKVILTTTGGQFSVTNRWQGSKQSISVGVVDCTLTDCVFTFYCDDYDKPLWAFGDSYFYDYAEPRWPEIVIGYDYTNAMFDGYGGRQSSAGWASLNKCLGFGTPKQIFWCLGMNDPDSSSAVNSSWNAVYTDLKAYCEENGIELILCTIPTTPTNNNNFKNAIIKASGLRYVDVAEAVGADGTGSWYTGLLGPDNIHPTAQGSKVIAARIMTEVPEMYISK